MRSAIRPLTLEVSLELLIKVTKLGVAIPSRIAKMASVIMSSTIVKPELSFNFRSSCFYPKIGGPKFVEEMARSIVHAKTAL
jgi:hypothetical protein